MGPDLRPMSCPSLTQVLGYDLAIRKRIALLMNSGVDIQSAMGHATADPDIRQKQFTASVGVAINTPECRALSAPGLREAYDVPAPRGGGTRANAMQDIPEPPTNETAAFRSQVQRVKKKAAKVRKQAEKAAADNAAKKAGNGKGTSAILISGVGDKKQGQWQGQQRYQNVEKSHRGDSIRGLGNLLWTQQRGQVQGEGLQTCARVPDL